MTPLPHSLKKPHHPRRQIPLFIQSRINNSLTFFRPEQEKRADVIAKCVLSEPKHGEVWQAVAKDPKNANKASEEVLNLVVELLE